MVKLAKTPKKEVKEAPPKKKAPPPKQVEESSDEDDDEEEAPPPPKAAARKNATPAKAVKNGKAAAKQESEEEDSDDDESAPVTPGKRKADGKKDKGTPPAKKTKADGETIDMSRRLTREERIEIVLMSGERSTRVIAADFNARHPTRPPISHATVSKLLAKFRETGSVLDLPKCGRMKTVTNEETSVAVLALVSKSPQRSIRRMSLESGISRTSLRRILATHKINPAER